MVAFKKVGIRCMGFYGLTILTIYGHTLLFDH